MTRDNAFVAQQIARQGEFANRVQEKQTALANSLLSSELTGSSTRFNVSSAEAFNNTLLLAQLLTPLLKTTASHPTPRSRAAARRYASGGFVGSRKGAIDRFAKEESVEDLGKQSENKPQTKTEEVDFKKMARSPKFNATSPFLN